LQSNFRSNRITTALYMTTWERFWGASRVYLPKYTGLFNRKEKKNQQKLQRNMKYMVPKSIQFPELASLTHKGPTNQNSFRYIYSYIPQFTRTFTVPIPSFLPTPCDFLVRWVYYQHFKKVSLSKLAQTV